MRTPERSYHWQYLDAIYPAYQEKPRWCGPGSLFIALRAFGKNVTQQEIVDRVDDIDNGMSWAEMVEGAERHGCTVGLYKNAEYNALVNAHDKSGCPIIVGWDSDRDGEPGAHFSVVKYINREMISLADPEFEDFVTYTKNEFEPKWFDEETRKAFMVIFPSGTGGEG